MAPLNWKKLMAVDEDEMEPEEADDYYKKLDEVAIGCNVYMETITTNE